MSYFHTCLRLIAVQNVCLQTVEFGWVLIVTDVGSRHRIHIQMRAGEGASAAPSPRLSPAAKAEEAEPRQVQQRSRERGEESQ